VGRGVKLTLPFPANMTTAGRWTPGGLGES